MLCLNEEKMMKKRALCLLLLICLAGTAVLFSLTACRREGASSSEEVREFFAMDTYMKLTAYGDGAKEALDEAQAEIQRLDALLSVGNPSGEVGTINRSGQGTLSPDTAELLHRSMELYETTGGAFDITVYPLMEAWGFTGDAPAVPSFETLQQALSLVGSSRLTEEGGQLTLSPGQGIDFGGIAKGYTGARVAEIFRKHGVSSGMIYLGGNVQCVGLKPDGELWRCGITDPQHPEGTSYTGIVTAADRAIVTSGGYERNFTDTSTGITYHHILDPHTGYPAEKGLLSVTIVSRDGTLADGLSTACFVMGMKEAVALWRSDPQRFDMVLTDSSGTSFITEGLKNNFESDRPFEVIAAS